MRCASATTIRADEPAVSSTPSSISPTPCRCGIEGGDDVAQLIPHLDRVRAGRDRLPAFRDGRGFLGRRILREAGYHGEIKATGDVLVDQILFMRRCGFDSFRARHPIDPAVLEARAQSLPLSSTSRRPTARYRCGSCVMADALARDRHDRHVPALHPGRCRRAERALRRRRRADHAATTLLADGLLGRDRGGRRRSVPKARCCCTSSRRPIRQPR